MPQLTVCFCKLARTVQATLFQSDFMTDIQKIINPDEKTVERYGRAWRFSKPKILDGYMYGELGYIAMGTEIKPFYDEEKQEFLQQTSNASLTNYVLWVLDLKYQTLAFEIKPPDIKYQSFKGAFECFLYKHLELGLRIEDFLEKSKFRAWADEVGRITSFRATLRLPNPNWSIVPKSIQDLIKDTNADKGKIELTKDKDSNDSLNTAETVIEDAVTYAEYGYSDILARGEKGKKPAMFDSRRYSPTDQVDIVKGITENEKQKAIKNMLDKFITRKYK
ncbi:MAG: hypothetical protein ACOWWR_19335 [Eubacteriales bacterium]